MKLRDLLRWVEALDPIYIAVEGWIVLIMPRNDEVAADAAPALTGAIS